MLNELLALPIISRRHLGRSFYCYIAKLDNGVIGFTVDVDKAHLQCIYLPLHPDNKKLFVDKLKQHNEKYRWMKLYDSEKPPAFREPKQLHQYCDMECKVWQTPTTNLAMVRNLLDDIRFTSAQEYRSNDEGYEYDLCSNADDNAWFN